MKFLIQPLENQCKEFLMSNINTDHACFVFGLAFTYPMDDLKAKALDFILKNGNKCLESEDFLSLPSTSLVYIVKPDELDCKESTVYLRLMEWAKLKCKDATLEATDHHVKTYLGEAFNFIRYPLMNINFFTNNVANTTLLSAGEKLKVYKQMSSIEKFSVRHRMLKANHILRCKVAYPRESLVDLNVNARISVSGPGLLTSVLLFGSKDYNGSHKVEITISKGKDVFTTKTTLHSIEGQEIYEVLLDRSVDMDKQAHYGINLKMEGPPTFRGHAFGSLKGTDGYVAQLIFDDNSLSKMKESQIPGFAFERNH